MRKIILAVGFLLVSMVLIPGTVKAGGCYYSRTADQISNGNPTKINFESTQTLPATGYWNSYGVMFTGSNSSAIYVNSYNRGGASTASGEYALFNNAIWPATSVNQSLKITFKNATRQVGLYLGNGSVGDTSTVANVKLFDQNGSQFCDMDVTVGSKNVNTFLGFETLLDFYSMTIDYGNTTLGEEIDDLMFNGSSTLVNNNAQCNKYCSDTFNKQGVCDINEPGITVGSAYCGNSTQCVCKANTCQNDSQCAAEGAHLKCLNNKCVFPSCDTACKEFYGYDYGSCGANTGNDVGSAFCGNSLGQCKCFKTEIPKQTTCSDTDNGLDSYVKGTTTGEKEGSRVFGNYVDSCSNIVGETGLTSGKWVVEQHCSGPNDNPYVHTQWNECPYGCVNGRCQKAEELVPQGICSDPDGMNIFKKSYSAGLNKVTNQKMNYVDYCATSETNVLYSYKSDYVSEWFCTAGGIMDSRISKCQYGCVDGACVSQPVIYAQENQTTTVNNDNDLMDTSDDEINECLGQTDNDGHFDLCTGETFIHQISAIKITNVRNNKNYIYLKLENSAKSTLVVYLGKSKDVYSKDWKKRIRITYENNYGDSTGKIRIQTMTGYGSMFCGNSVYNEGSFTSCLGSTITNYPTKIKFTIKNFNDDFVWLGVSGSNVYSAKIAKGKIASLPSKNNTFLQIGYENWAGGPQVNLNVKVLGMDCGDSTGADGVYSACMNNTIFHNTSGVSAKVNNFTDKFIVFVFDGSSNYNNNTGVRLDKGKELIVQSVNGTKLRYTYQAINYKSGISVKIETIQ